LLTRAARYDSAGGSGPQPYVHKIPLPDDYRGPYRRADALAGPKYARAVQEAIDRLQQRGQRLGAFVAESLMGSSGQIVFPPGFLREAYAHVRAAGGVTIADEVQVGFGRVGSHFWGFETQGVVPDIVVLGKPMGNGHPLGAVITTPAIAASFNNGLEFFSTFGGNPVSCAIGMAVLDVIEAEQLRAKAERVGQRLMGGLRELADTHPLIGDVRGLGLFNGVELVQDRETLAPAPQQTAYVVNRLKERGVLVSIDGPFHNVLKIKPPLAFDEADADFFVETLNTILSEEAAQA
jgi:4-aminobutyrate aminotransferase-like enzyme